MKKNLGFTLIEIVIVLAIIGVLGVAIISAIDPFEIGRIGRDNIRLTMINKLAQALELYFAANKTYPPQNSASSSRYVDSVRCEPLIPFDRSLDIRPTPAWTQSACYVDPIGCYYLYTIDYTKREYKLHVKLESKGFNLPVNYFAGIDLQIVLPSSNPSFYRNGKDFPSGCSITSETRILVLTKKW